MKHLHHLRTTCARLAHHIRTRLRLQPSTVPTLEESVVYLSALEIV